MVRRSTVPEYLTALCIQYHLILTPALWDMYYCPRFTGASTAVCLRSHKWWVRVRIHTRFIFPRLLLSFCKLNQYRHTKQICFQLGEVFYSFLFHSLNRCPFLTPGAIRCPVQYDFYLFLLFVLSFRHLWSLFASLMPLSLLPLTYLGNVLGLVNSPLNWDFHAGTWSGKTRMGG